MKDFNIEISYSIISAIKAGIREAIPEDNQISYDIDTAEEIYNNTNGYQLMDTVKYIETTIAFYNMPVIGSYKKTVSR